MIPNIANGLILRLGARSVMTSSMRRTLAIGGLRSIATEKPPPAATSTANSSTNDNTSSSSSSTPDSKVDQKKDDKDKPMSWLKFWLYAGTGISSIVFVYHFYQASYNLSKTGVLLKETYFGLPFYWPAPDSRALARQNSSFEVKNGLKPEVAQKFAEWFVSADAIQQSGVSKDDVLDLVEAMGFSRELPAYQSFLCLGSSDDDSEDLKRRQGAGLRESVAFLSELFALSGDGTPSQDKALVILENKVQGFAPLSGGAAAFRQVPLVPMENMEEEADMVGEEADKFELARLTRLEDALIARLERLGGLSPAEESRLRNIREQKNALNK